MYNGHPDLRVFDKWAYEVNNWVRLSKYTNQTALLLLVTYISKTTSEFFMDYVAGNEGMWTMMTMYEALFDYCFPTDFKDQLQARLTQLVQGKRNIRDFVCDLEKLAF